MGLLFTILVIVAIIWLVSTIARGAAYVMPGGVLGLVLLALLLWLVFRA